jgi:hypothetical protein
MLNIFQSIYASLDKKMTVIWICEVFSLILIA